VRIAGRMGGIKGKPQVLEKKKRKLTLFDILFGDVQDTMSRLNGSKMELKYLLP
jgi:hypothetical protein